MLVAIEPRDTAVDACARALREAVLKGELAVGGRLPPERVLAQTFTVNRVTVRHALARLVDAGLLSVRQGSGYVVQDYVKGGGPELVAALAEHASPRELVAIVRDLLEVRRAVARAIVERIARKRPPRAAVQRVTAAIDALEAQARSGATPGALAQADLAVLAAVVACTGSVVLQLALNPVASTLLGLPALVRAMFSAPLETVAGWRLLAQWLKAPSAWSGAVDVLMGVLTARDEATLKAMRKELA